MPWRRLKFCLRRPLQYGATESGIPFEDGVALLRYIRITDISESGQLQSEAPLFLPTDVGEPYLLQPGDILLARSGATVGKAFIFEGDRDAACYAGYLIRANINPSIAIPRFVYYCLQSDVFWNYVRSNYSQATIQNLNAHAYASVPIPCHDLTAQSAITTFLDYETAKADALVAKYERLIELLEEKRVALVTHAVTKGLDQTVPMRESGVEWIGEIPRHWSFQRLKFHASKIGSGITPRGGTEVYTSSGVALLRSQNVRDEGLSMDDVKFIPPEIDDEMAGTRVQENDVLLNITGASIGRSCIVPRTALPANVNQHVCIIRPNGMAPSFIAAVIRSHFVKEQVLANENGSSREGLNYRQVGDLLVPVPPSEGEQAAIAKHVERDIAALNSVIQSAQGAIALTREHRSALISAAVAGHIDVRTYRSAYDNPEEIPS